MLSAVDRNLECLADFSHPHAVATAYELFPGTIARQLHDAGFVDIEVGVCPTPDGVRPFDQATVLAITPGI